MQDKITYNLLSSSRSLVHIGFICLLVSFIAQLVIVIYVANRSVTAKLFDYKQKTFESQGLTDGVGFVEYKALVSRSIVIDYDSRRDYYVGETLISFIISHDVRNNNPTPKWLRAYTDPQRMASIRASGSNQACLRRIGWPLPCASIEFRRHTLSSDWHVVDDRALVLNNLVIPLHLLWRGLLLDVAVLLLICFVMWTCGCRQVCRAIIKHIRTRRVRLGYCGHCLYPLRGLTDDVCPECGQHSS